MPGFLAYATSSVPHDISAAETMPGRKFISSDDARSRRMEEDVAHDERAFLDRLAELREGEGISLETLGFMLGTTGGHISRYLKYDGRITLVNFLRVARALGYRCDIIFKKLDDGSAPTLNDVKHRSPRNP